MTSSINTKKSFSIFGKKHLILFFIMLPLLLPACSKNVALKTSGSIKKTKKAVRLYETDNWHIKQKAIRKIIKELKKNDISRIENAAEKILLQASMDNHTAIQIEASIGLGYLKSRTSLSMLLALAAPSSSDNVRWYAIQSLKRRNSPLALKVYLLGIQSKDWVIREVSIIGLLSLREKNQQKENLPAILQCLNDATIPVRISTLINLQIQDRRIYRAIIKNLYRKKPSALLTASLEAIRGYMLDEKTKDIIIEMLSHPSTRIRILALRALKEDRKIRLDKSRHY